MPRAVKEWVGKTDDSKAPPKVGLRIWREQDGICGLCHRKIMPTDKKHLHHKLALILGGANRESNLTWTHAACNQTQAKAEVEIRSDTDAKAKKHLGIRRVGPQPEIRSAPMATTPKAAKRAERGHREGLPPRNLYVDIVPEQTR